MRDDPLNAIEWRDLLVLNHWEIANELSLSLPWLLGSWAAAALGAWLLALGASFMFFAPHRVEGGKSRRAPLDVG